MIIDDSIKYFRVDTKYLVFLKLLNHRYPICQMNLHSLLKESIYVTKLSRHLLRKTSLNRDLWKQLTISK